jgi:RHS repeat-associated protein
MMEEGYDGRDRLKSLTTKNVVGVTFSSFEYVLDAAGNRTKVTDHDGRVVEYQYDSLNRLTQEKMTDTRLGNRTADYVYDLVGNRSSKTDTVDGTTTYAYDWNDRLTSTTRGNQTTQFTYDNNGSMKTRSNGAQTITYDWINDGENRMVSVSDGTNQTQFVYDAFGKRVATIDQGTRTNYFSASIWGLPEVLMEYDANGNVTADYTQGMGTVRSRRDNREVFHHTDGLGSTRALTDTVGLVTDRYTYDAYGVLLEHQGTFGNSFQFAGEQRDSSTGLDYLRARYYDSSLGRFTSSDPYSGSMGDPMSLHNYQYAHANPTRYTDPTGYFSMAEQGAILAIGATIASASWTAAFVAGRYIAGERFSGEELLNMTDQWVAGYANNVSFGISSKVRVWRYGQEIEQNHSGAFWNMGQIAATAISFVVGSGAPKVLSFSMESTKWIGTI